MDLIHEHRQLPGHVVWVQTVKTQCTQVPDMAALLVTLEARLVATRAGAQSDVVSRRVGPGRRQLG